MPSVSIKSNANNQLRTNYARTLKQIKRDYKELMARLPQIDQSLSGSEAFAREFGEKVINKLVALEADAQKLGKDSHTLPLFIKKKDLFALSSIIKPFLSKFCESEVWLRRLTGADSKQGRDESHKKSLKRLERFKEKLKGLIAKDSNELEQYLPSLEKFALGTLRAFNDYTKPLRIATKITRSLHEFCEQGHKGSLQREQANVLAQILGQLNRISESLITKEELGFKKTKEYREAGSPFDQRALLNKHMTSFRESLSVEENLEFLERVLKSQQPLLKRKLTKEEQATLTEEEKEKIAQWKADKKAFAPLFKRDANAEKQGKAIDIIQQLTDLHAALVATEATRIMYQEAVKQATQPETRKRKIDSIKPSSTKEETTGTHKKQKTGEGKYARKMRLFQEAEQQPEQTEQTVDMDLETVEAHLAVSSHSK